MIQRSLCLDYAGQLLLEIQPLSFLFHSGLQCFQACFHTAHIHCYALQKVFDVSKLSHSIVRCDWSSVIHLALSHILFGMFQ